MKEHEHVKLIRDRAEYKNSGVKKGDIGIIIGGERNGYYLVSFYGEKYVVDGIELLSETDVGVRAEDLEVVGE